MPALIYSKGFFLTARQHAPAGSTTAKKLRATLEQLEADWPHLPAPDDRERPLPPVSTCWTRKVPGTALIVCFQSGATGVTILAVKRWDE